MSFKLKKEGRFPSLNTRQTGQIQSLNSLIPIQLLFDVIIEVSGSDSEKDDMRLVPTLSLVVLKLSRTSFGWPFDPSFTKGRN